MIGRRHDENHTRGHLASEKMAGVPHAIRPATPRESHGHPAICPAGCCFAKAPVPAPSLLAIRIRLHGLVKQPGNLPDTFCTERSRKNHAENQQTIPTAHRYDFQRGTGTNLDV